MECERKRKLAWMMGSVGSEAHQGPFMVDSNLVLATATSLTATRVICSLVSRSVYIA